MLEEDCAEDEEVEVEEDDLVSSALQLSRRLGDDVFELHSYDMLEDADYSSSNDTSIPQELQEMAAFFTQLMQQQGGVMSEEDNAEEMEDKESINEVGGEEEEEEEIEEEVEEVTPRKECAAHLCVPNEMHRAVFKCDVAAITALLDEEHKANPQDYSNPFAPYCHSTDTPDHCGNTPLLLAIKLGYFELAKLLIAEGFQCDVSYKLHMTSLEGSSVVQEGPTFRLLDECVLSRNISLIKAVYKQMQRQTYGLWLEKRDAVLKSLLNIPDFYVELNWEFKGSGLMGPVVKMFAPYDTYRIWKRGNWLRLDSTIGGIHSNDFRVERAHLSLIFQGSSVGGCLTAAGEGELFVLNHTDQTYERMLRKFSHPSDAELQLFALQMVQAHSARSGLMAGVGGGKGGVNDMKVNSVDLDADNWSVKALADSGGAPKTVRLGGEARRDVYAQSRPSVERGCASGGPVDGSATTVPATAKEASSAEATRSTRASRLCYKWEARGQISASLAVKTSQDARAFHTISEAEYFGAVPEMLRPQSSLKTSAAGEGAPRRSKWARLRGKLKNYEPESAAGAEAVAKSGAGAGAAEGETSQQGQRVMKARGVKRKVSAAICMVKDYPISLSELLPVLDIFAMKNEYLKKLVAIFNGNEGSIRTSPTSGEQETGDAPSFLNIPAELFPYRVQVPIILGISAVATFDNFERNPHIDPALFRINTGQYNELVDTVLIGKSANK